MTSIRNRLSVPLAALLLFAGGAIALLHVLRPDIDPLARTISQYLNGDYSLIARAAILVAALTLALFAHRLPRVLAVSGATRWSQALLIVTAIGFGITALIPPDVPTIELPLSPGGWAHRASAIVAFTAMTVATGVLTPIIPRDPRWPPIGGLLRALALFALAALVFAALVWAAHWPLFGLAERLLALAVMLWMLVVAWNMPAAS
ncbi:MAG: DUF998 domain-containing protein [Chloroflexi bacterium]|nr:DUF998 domain-containing protein [Chloroflexota bacterium]